MDGRLYRDFNRLAVDTAWAHTPIKVFAVDGVAVFAILVIAAWWFARSAPDAPRAVAASLWTAASAVAAVGINQPIVSAVHRARPFQTMPGVEVLVSRSHDLSFPSDHAVAVGAVVTGLWIVARLGGRPSRRIAIVATVLGAFLAFSRVYVGAHYPGDVVAGLALGLVVTLIGWFILDRSLTRAISAIGHGRCVRILVYGRSGQPGDVSELLDHPMTDSPMEAQ